MQRPCARLPAAHSPTSALSAPHCCRLPPGTRLPAVPLPAPDARQLTPRPPSPPASATACSSASPPRRAPPTARRPCSAGGRLQRRASPAPTPTTCRWSGVACPMRSCTGQRGGAPPTSPSTCGRCLPGLAAAGCGWLLQPASRAAQRTCRRGVLAGPAQQPLVQRRRRRRAAAWGSPGSQLGLSALLPSAAQLPLYSRRAGGGPVRRPDGAILRQPVRGPRRVRRGLLQVPRRLVRRGLQQEGGGARDGAGWAAGHLTNCTAELQTAAAASECVCRLHWCHRPQMCYTGPDNGREGSQFQTFKLA
jgi:hypothetical protein